LKILAPLRFAEISAKADAGSRRGPLALVASE